MINDIFCYSIRKLVWFGIQGFIFLLFIILNILRGSQARIYNDQLIQNEGVLSGEIELEERYFGSRRIRGKRGRGAKDKTVVFGLLKRNGKVYTHTINKVSKKELLLIIKGTVLQESTVDTD